MQLVTKTNIIYRSNSPYRKWKVIENSAVSVKENKFDLVADLSVIRIDPNAFDTIYKVYGKHIYPSFILPNTTLGITEIDAVRATHDYGKPEILTQI